MKKILTIEDDVELGRRLVRLLSDAGFATRSVSTLERGKAIAASDKIDLVIIDLSLPDGFGLDLVKDLRKDIEVPIIVLTAHNDPSLRIRALQLGADDFINKPFWPPELLARIEARLRRPNLETEGGMDFGPIRMNADLLQVWVSGSPILLTAAEFHILHRLVASHGKATTRAALSSASCTETGSLDVHISRLRKKLDPVIEIATVWGIGYRLEIRPAP
ncbi:MAG: response regulator transcription factor [Myxococcota bacterium]